MRVKYSVYINIYGFMSDEWMRIYARRGLYTVVRRCDFSQKPGLISSFSAYSIDSLRLQVVHDRHAASWAFSTSDQLFHDASARNSGSNPHKAGA